MGSHAANTEPLGELEERLCVFTTLLTVQFSADELHDLAESLADDLLRDGLDVRSGSGILGSS